LFKIKFDKPDKNTRIKILENKLPELNENERQYIVNNYDLTGAQIENISFKLEIKKVINKNISFNDINILCKEETDNCFTQDQKTIGFLYNIEYLNELRQCTNYNISCILALSLEKKWQKIMKRRNIFSWFFLY